MKRMSFVTTLILLSLAVSAGAQTVLWDQTAGYESWTQGFYNAIAGMPPMGSTYYTVNDVVVPSGGWTVQEGHDLVERVEADVRDAIPYATVFTHLEPLEDPRSFDDTALDRR